MQVNTAHRNDALTRHRERLRDAALEDRTRADQFTEQANSELARAEEKKTASSENRDKGENLKRESDRLRRNGREQSLRGLNRLADGSDRYSESFQKQETGLSDLQSSLDSIKQANDAKSGALQKIDGGLNEQSAHNAVQGETVGRLESSHREGRALTQQKGADAAALSENNDHRGSELNIQTERVADFILAGDNFEQGAATKKAGVRDLSSAVGHRVQSEAYSDVKSEAELKGTWSEQDAQRHQKADTRLFFDSLFESLRAKAADTNAAIHHRAAQKGEMNAEELQQMADGLKAHAESCMQNARTLECSGQHHIAVGQQMKCCPWTYCQGVALERQGYAEIARAQEMKQHAQSMRQEAQAKAVEAETSRVKAEQAREIGNEYQVEGHGSAVRSDILKERSENHGANAEKAIAQAEESKQKAEKMARAAADEMEQAAALNQSGKARFQEGMTEQRAALGEQVSAVTGFHQSVGTEDELQSGAGQYVSRVSQNLSSGRSVLGRNRALLEALRGSVSGEEGSQQKVQDGIDEFKTGRSQSVESTEKGRQAALLLEQARDLELEGLRLQNSGQKMLLEARPKMANAARLSAESFDAYKKADSQEEEAGRLIAQGTQKLAAAEILRQKAAAYDTIADKN